MGDSELDNPPVTVAIPAYNHSRFIDETLEAVAAQTCQNLELVIVDDGSSDGTFERVEGFLERHRDRFRWVHAVTRPNKGVAATMNELIEVARTEWIFFSASDDVMYPNRIERQLQAIHDWNDPNIALVSAQVDYIDNDGNPAERLQDSTQTGLFETAYIELFLENQIWSPTVALHRDKIRALGGFDTSLGFEDWDMWLRLAVVHPIGILPDILGAYRVHDANASKIRLNMLEGTLMTLGKFLESHAALVPSTVKRRVIRKNAHRIRRLRRAKGVARLYWDILLFRYTDPEPADFYRYAGILREIKKSEKHP